MRSTCKIKFNPKLDPHQTVMTLLIKGSEFASSGVTESLFGGQRGGQTVGGGGGPRGRYRNVFFPITFIVHNQKSNEGPMV